MFHDRIFTTVEVHLSWVDRIKVLLGGRVCVRAVVATEHEVGATSSTSEAWVPELFERRDRAEAHRSLPEWHEADVR